MAHNCHGKTKSHGTTNLTHGKTKLTHGKAKLTHGKTKKTSWSAVVIWIWNCTSCNSNFPIFTMIDSKFYFSPTFTSNLFFGTRNKNDICLKHVTSSTLVKCNSMIISIIMPSYPNVTLFLCYFTFNSVISISLFNINKTQDKWSWKQSGMFWPLTSCSLTVCRRTEIVNFNRLPTKWLNFNRQPTSGPPPPHPL